MNLIPKQKIIAVLKNSNLELPEIQISDFMILRLQEFCSILVKWNDKINLTSEKDPIAILEKHIFDSLQYLRWLNSSQTILDIGSGAGFPGVPLKIMHPDLQITLMESQKKRCSFLREVIRTLKLENTEVAEGRAEDYSRQEAYIEKFDRVLFRGFSSLDTCLTTGFPFLKAGGQVILKKSPEEMPDATREITPDSRIAESVTVEGLKGQKSLMIVIEKCST